jgi:hypothetical protein
MTGNGIEALSAFTDVNKFCLQRMRLHPKRAIASSARIEARASGCIRNSCGVADGHMYGLLSMSVRLSRLACPVAPPWALAVAVVAVVAIAAAPAWAVTPKDGHYAGFVDPFKIGFTVANGKISHFVTDFEATTCPGLAPSSTSSSFEFPSVKIRNGRFSDSKTLHYRSGLDPHFTITGRFSKPTRAAGTLHEHIAVPANFGAPSCTLSQPFSVTRVSK